MKMDKNKKIILVLAVAIAVSLLLIFKKSPEIEGSSARDNRQMEAIGISGAIPYPEAPPREGRAVKKFPLESLLVYKKLPEYSQPAWMDSFIEKGLLPPVHERLPDEPCVIPAASMSDGPGEYGGIWRGVYCSPLEGWNWGAGQSQGWFGVNGILQQPLVITGPIFLRNDKIEALPHLAKSWKWSADGYELVMNLIKGAKWSDGHPFTTDDVIFTWEDCILDDNVQSFSSRTAWQINGKQVKLKALDKYTLKWTFPVPFPVRMLFQMDERDFGIAPAHILKPFHPRYNPKADYLSFENCLTPEQLPPVTMGAWIPVYYKTDEILVMRRNPYYWKVDERGRQLPYINEIVFERGADGTIRTLKTLSGAADQTNLENPSTFIQMLKARNSPESHFTIEWGPETLGFSLIINQALTLGVRTEKDRSIRQLLRDLRFRKALSHAMDRKGLASTIIRGPFLRSWCGGLFPGSPYFDVKSAVYYPYSPQTARALLAEIGFKDIDGDGFLNWTSGPLKSKILALGLMYGVEAKANILLAEAMVPLFAQVGIKINLHPGRYPEIKGAEESGKWDMGIHRLPQEYAVPFAYADMIAPIKKEAPVWHREGKEPRVLQPFEEEMIDIVNRFAGELDIDKRKSMMNKYNRIFTENLYNIGIFIGSYGLAIAKRFRNVQPGTPVFLYQWTWSNVRSEQVWVPEKERIKEMMPGILPLYQKKTR
jgi:peptide/nickel transport system substrate-binding protein